MKLLYPEKCIACRKIIEGEVFCKECEKIYKDKFGYKMGDKALEKCVFALFYEEKIKTAVWLFKFRSRRHFARPFSALLSEAFYHYYRAEDFDLIVPVPITPKSLYERGYNHSALMAKYFGKEVGISVEKNAIIKIRDTNQHLKTLSERRRNINGAFKADPKTDLKGKRILLVDDVLTTGLTMKECARILKRAGARLVSGLALTSNGIEPLVNYR